jgi:hypothetical protein
MTRFLLALCVAIWFTGCHAIAVPVQLVFNSSVSSGVPNTSPVTVVSLRVGNTTSSRTGCALSPTSVTRSDRQPIAGTSAGPGLFVGIFATVATQRDNLTHTEVMSDNDVCSGFNGIGDMTSVYVQFGRALRADDVLVIVDTVPADDIVVRSQMRVRIERLSDNQTIGRSTQILDVSNMWSANLGGLSCRATNNRNAADGELTFSNIG